MNDSGNAAESGIFWDRSFKEDQVNARNGDFGENMLRFEFSLRYVQKRPIRQFRQGLKLKGEIQDGFIESSSSE